MNIYTIYNLQNKLKEVKKTFDLKKSALKDKPKGQNFSWGYKSNILSSPDDLGDVEMITWALPL